MLNLDANGIALVAVAVSLLGLAGQAANLLMKLSIATQLEQLENRLKDYMRQEFVDKDTCEANQRALEVQISAARGR